MRKIRIRNPFKNRTPVLRYRARQNILITLLSFAFSVSATRLFLELTGYPQLGGGELHIAHVLWGGLFLFVAALLPILYANEWAHSLSALIAGLGVGLFIDEVGKFITSTNDYFYPSAAPIVYVFFLLTALLGSQVRNHRPRNARSKMYAVLERFTEVLDRDLSTTEREELVQSLGEIRDSKKDHDLSTLAESLRSYLEKEQSKAVTEIPNFLDRIRGWLLKIEDKFFSRKKVRFWLVLGFFAWGIWAMVSPFLFYHLVNDPAQLQLFVNQLMTNNLVRNASGLTWFEARVVMEGGLGLFALLSAGLILFKAEKAGVWMGVTSLLITLTIVNLLVFYFDQFSTIILASLQFVLLVLSLRYRQRFLSKS